MELALALASVVLITASAVLLVCSRKLLRTQREYEKARGAVEDIVLSVNRQFRRVAERLELVAYKVEAGASRSDRAISKAEDVEKQQKFTGDTLGALSVDRDKILVSVGETGRQVRDVVALHEALAARVTALEEQAKQQPASTGPSVETVIPLRRDKALAPLTDTELAALELLAAEGPKTAPDIKWRIRLSREHTARLMKKLYEEGYLERDPSKIPFKYSVKKEMEKLLKKPQEQAS